MFCFGYLWEKPWWETPRPILQTTAATWGVCIWDIYLYRYPHLGMVHRQLARMDNVFPFHHLPGFKKCEPLKSERFANWNMIIFNGSWLNSMGRCPPLRRPTQSSAKLVFVTSAAVEIHGNPRRFEWATNLHCHLWWPEGNSLFYPVSSYFHYHYCYYDSMPTIQWFDMICSGQMVGWCGVDVFFFNEMNLTTGRFRSECHTSPSSALGRKLRITFRWRWEQESNHIYRWFMIYDDLPVRNGDCPKTIFRMISV
jgi:hypothetical protein